MKIKTTVTEIECTANELRQSNNLADGFLNILRGCFNSPIPECPENEPEDESEEMENEDE